MISGPCQETSYTAITLNPESNFTRREKNHFLLRWSTSTLPEIHIIGSIVGQFFLMITGTWMEKENYQMHEQDSQDSFYWTKGHLTDIHGPGGTYEKTNKLLVLTMCGQICGSVCLMHRSEKQSKNELSRNQNSKMADINGSRKSPMPPAMPCKTPVSCRGETCRNIREKQDQICLYCRCRRIFENTIGRSTAQVSWRSHRFIEPLQLGAQVYSDASSIKKSWMQMQQWKMGNTWENTAWQLTKVRNKTEVIAEARNKGRNVHFASLMDLCHLKN